MDMVLGTLQGLAITSSGTREIEYSSGPYLILTTASAASLFLSTWKAAPPAVRSAQPERDRRSLAAIVAEQLGPGSSPR